MLLPLLLLWVHLLWSRESGIRRARRLPCFLCFPSPIPPFLTLRPFLSRAFPARLSFLLATLFDGLAPSVGVGRCPYGPTKRFATMSCVCSTHHFLRSSSSFPSSFQRNFRCHLSFSIVPFLGLDSLRYS